MASVRFEARTLALHDDESVLECLERHGVEIASSCRSGICQSCLLRCLEGRPPSHAQAGLRPELVRQGGFLACSWRPEGDVVVARPDDAGFRTRARVYEITPLRDAILRVRLTPELRFEYVPGQFANLVRPEGVVRSYSLASHPEEDDFVEFHVAAMPNGRMSGWLANQASPGDLLDIMGPLGHCYYVKEEVDRPLLLVGTGTGLAPLYGILRDALRKGHSAPIHLVHGSVTDAGLYLVEGLRALAYAYPNLEFTPCVLEGAGARPGVTVGAIDALVMNHRPSYRGWRAYLCGHPDIVKLLQRKLFLAGAALSDIHADAFLPSATKNG